MNSLLDIHTALHAWQQHRCQHAAAWIISTHRPLVLRSACRWHLPAEMHEDAVQEVFIRVFQRLSRWNPQRPFVNWLAVITRNICAKLSRRWRHRRVLSACFENAALDVESCDLPDTRRPDLHLMQREQETYMHRVLETLPRREMRLIQLHAAHEDGARHFTGAQRTALSRARAKIRMQIGSGRIQPKPDFFAPGSLLASA